MGGGVQNFTHGGHYPFWATGLRSSPRHKGKSEGPYLRYDSVAVGT